MLTKEAFPKGVVSAHAGVTAIAIIAVMAGGVWQMIAAGQALALQDFPHTWTDFREGRTTGMIEKQLDQKLPARSALIAAANSTRYVLTGSGGDQVRSGQDGWLFLTDELRFEADGNAHLQARADLLKSAAQGLAKHGTRLVVALVPDKARIYAPKLANGAYPAYLRARYPAALTALRQRGVTVVDLLQPLDDGAKQNQLYYHTDTHWNQTGARAAAEAVARTIRQLGIDLDQTTYATTQGPAVERPGDLIRLMGLDNMPNALRPRPDSESIAVTRQTSADAASGLFGDAVVPITLTGTSYSLRGNFHGFLQQALSAKVLNAAKDGGGFLQATTAYLKDEAFRGTKPKILIWEVPERFLWSPLVDESGWLEKTGLSP